ncbi:hypothetical protein Bca101_027802 [Brassica carinata]
MGLGWAVGTGKNINVWSDNWLSTGEISRPIGPPNFHDQNLMVQDLLHPTSCEWNVTAVRSHLPQVLNWRSCVWNIDTSPKLKLFLWKLSNKALPVGEAVARRGINVNTDCKRCGGSESEVHTFFQCPFAAKVWDLMPALHKPTASNSIYQLLDSSKSSINLPPAGLAQPLYPWILWNLWTSRNQLLFEDRKYTELEVLNKAIHDAREWSWAQSSPTQKFPATPPHPRLESTNPSTFFCFTDGAWDAG